MMINLSPPQKLEDRDGFVWSINDEGDGLSQSLAKLWALQTPLHPTNYIWAMSFAGEDGHHHAVVIDPADGGAVQSWLVEENIRLEALFITHRHGDHTKGIAPLQAFAPHCVVYGHPLLIQRGHTINQPVAEGQSIDLPYCPPALIPVCGRFTVIETPAHTLEHVVFINEHFLFCGDTLFSMGCGRAFEDTPEALHRAIQKIVRYINGHNKQDMNPWLCCSHEYTASNVAFCADLEAVEIRAVQAINQVINDNNGSICESVCESILAKQKQVEQCLAQKIPSLPVRFNDELKLNPFLRCHEKPLALRIQARIQQDGETCDINDTASVFAALRYLKDRF